MSYAKFTTEAEAQEYADMVQAELSKNSMYVAERWSEIQTGSDGAYYVYVHKNFIPQNAVLGQFPQLDSQDNG
jgi:hypothetical protein